MTTKASNQTSLLQKMRKDLTKEDIAALEKPLGIRDDPFPMYGTQRLVDDEGNVAIDQVLSVIASDFQPLMVYSDRPEEDVVAIALCDMPVPSMLPLFFEGLLRRAPDSTKRAQTFFGDPGYGKSFLGALQGRLRSTRPPVIVDCGGRNLRDLFFEMVLDFGPADALPDAIDKRAAAGTLKPLSLGLLKQLNTGLETAPEEYKDKPEALAEWQLKHEIVTYTQDGRPVVDWEKLKTGGEEKINNAFKILQRISKIEGLDKAAGNALGMKAQKGILIRADEEGFEVVLDEYNKSRINTDDMMQGYWQYQMGGSKSFTVENTLKNANDTTCPAYYEFKQENQKAGHFVTVTGNRRIDGTTTRELSKSAYSRLQPDTLPDPGLLDWQHRICQILTGMPVSTIYHAYKNHGDRIDPDKHPEKFGQWLMDQRQLKAKIDGMPVPEDQFDNLSNWQDIVQASELLAEFFMEVSGYFDIDKLIIGSNADLLDEIDKEFSDKEAMDFRRLMYILEAARSIRPRMVAPEEELTTAFTRRSKNRVRPEPEEERLSVQQGTRLMDIIDQYAAEKSALVRKPKLYQKIVTAMEKCALRAVSLLEGALSGQKSVEECLNISSFTDRNLSRRAEAARKTFCNYLRQVDPAITGSDEDIVSLQRMSEVLKAVAQTPDDDGKAFLVINRDHDHLSAIPFAPAVVRDSAAYKAAGKEALDFGLDDLVSHDDFLASMAIPTVTAKNLSAIWETNISALVDPAATPDTLDEGLKIAQNLSAQGLAVTSVQVLQNDENGDRAVTVDIIHNGGSGKTVIVGEKLPSKLAAAFREAGITHIDRNDAAARSKLEVALRDVTLHINVETRKGLVEAFKYRNNNSPDVLEEGKLAALVLDKNRVNVFPKFIVKKG